MATTRTRDQLVDRALTALLIVGSGQSAQAEDQQTVDALYEPLRDQLADDQICIITNDDEIPGAWFLPLSELLANVAATSFGGQFDPSKKMVFEAQLKRMNSTRPDYEAQATEYF